MKLNCKQGLLYLQYIGTKFCTWNLQEDKALQTVENSWSENMYGENVEELDENSAAIKY